MTSAILPGLGRVVGFGALLTAVLTLAPEASANKGAIGYTIVHQGDPLAPGLLAKLDKNASKTLTGLGRQPARHARDRSVSGNTGEPLAEAEEPQITITITGIDNGDDDKYANSFTVRVELDDDGNGSDEFDDTENDSGDDADGDVLITDMDDLLGKAIGKANEDGK